MSQRRTQTTWNWTWRWWNGTIWNRERWFRAWNVNRTHAKEDDRNHDIPYLKEKWGRQVAAMGNEAVAVARKASLNHIGNVKIRWWTTRSEGTETWIVWQRTDPRIDRKKKNDRWQHQLRRRGQDRTAILAPALSSKNPDRWLNPCSEKMMLQGPKKNLECETERKEKCLGETKVWESERKLVLRTQE